MTPGSANDAPAAAAAAAASAASAVGENQRTVGHGNLSGRVLPVVPVVEMQREPHSFAAAAADTIASDTEVDGEWPSDASSYDILSKIGQGAFATVFLAKCHSSPPGEASGDGEGDGEEDGGNGVCAIKILDLENVDANFTDIRLEVQTMRMSQHNNILRCYTSFIRETNLYLVMPLMNRGSSLRCLEMTRKHLKRRWRHEQHQRGTSGTGGPPDLRLEEHLTYILFETLKGLQYIHGNLHLIHRDIKAGNVLLDWMAKVKVADFGVSGWLQRGGSRREQTRTFVGTPAWMSPELMEQVEGYNHKTDLWSLGITALELAKGYAPYAKFPPIKVLLLTIQEEPPSLDTYDDDDDEEDVGEEDCSDNVGGERYDTGTGKWSNTFRDVINRCLQKNPKDRPDCDDLLNHAHFRHLLDEDALDSAQTHTKEAVCDVVGDIITSSSSAAAAAAKKKDKEGYYEKEEANSKASSTVRIVSTAVSEEDRPAGTTWVFSDGSQVTSSSRLDESLNEAEDKEAFFADFERQTGGENFFGPASQPKSTTNDDFNEEQFHQKERNDKGATKDDMNDFFDEFEKTTGGENFRINIT